ncbi:hypothetical protein MSIMFI_01718 [Mycobacterium simulans]|uniref:sensor domain-containing protein n=1 Tax=Mycobacterium simulans TaxID=627089 RepID=UPI00174CEAC9|nr:sensor domain-containing protein [Mycobacterium simulans]SON60224.1 hypothetical protein MSIMFI_01718 [Mycobacterium simulans]
MCRAIRWPAILLAAVLAVAGCTATVSGTALPATTLGHTTTTATTGPTPRIIGVSVLEGLLLTGDQIVGLVGGTNMVSVGTINNTSDAATIIDDRTCIGIGSIADMSVYSNSGWRYSFHSSNGNHSSMDTGSVRGSGSRMDVLLRQEEDPRWACTHAMAVQDSVFIEARVCLLNKDSTAAVNNLLDQVIARIPQ